MIDPLFWLGLSILLVAVSLTAVLVTALPALQELARAARSAEKLFDTLRRELPPTLEAIRLTGMEISDLTDEFNEGVKSASQAVKQVDQSLSGAKKQAQNVQVTTRSVFAGVQAAWKTLRHQPSSRRSIERVQTPQRNALEFPTSLEDERESLNPSRSSDRNRLTSYRDRNRPSAYLIHHEDVDRLDSEDDSVSTILEDEVDESAAP
ncbi:MAG: hypothetical protein NVSMB70_12000 [Chamaesiphon sp.]